MSLYLIQMTGKYGGLILFIVACLMIVVKFVLEITPKKTAVKMEPKNSIIENAETENIEAENTETESIETENTETKNTETEKIETFNEEKPFIKTSNFFIIIKAVSAVLISRFVIFISVYIYNWKINKGTNNFFEAFTPLWLKWDASGYLRIAENFYNTNGAVKFDIALYPLYPMVIRIFRFFTNSYFSASIVASNILFVVALFFLYKFIELEYKNVKMANSAMVFAVVIPFSFFFGIGYTESLFFAMSIISIYLARKKIWMTSAFFCALACLTRTQGILLFAPLLIEYLKDAQPIKLIKEKNIKMIYLHSIRLAVCCLIASLGTFTYLLINKLVYGDWLKFLELQAQNWNQRFGYFADNISGFIYYMSIRDANQSLGIFLPNTIFFFLSIILLIFAIPKMRLSLCVYSILYIWISFSPTWLLSGARYMIGMFTMYIMFSILVKNKYVKLITYALLGVLCVCSGFLFCLNVVY